MATATASSSARDHFHHLTTGQDSATFDPLSLSHIMDMLQCSGTTAFDMDIFLSSSTESTTTTATTEHPISPPITTTTTSFPLDSTTPDEGFLTLLGVPAPPATAPPSLIAPQELDRRREATQARTWFDANRPVEESFRLGLPKRKPTNDPAPTNKRRRTVDATPVDTEATQTTAAPFDFDPAAFFYGLGLSVPVDDAAAPLLSSTPVPVPETPAPKPEAPPAPKRRPGRPKGSLNKPKRGSDTPSRVAAAASHLPSPALASGDRIDDAPPPAAPAAAPATPPSPAPSTSPTLQDDAPAAPAAAPTSLAAHLSSFPHTAPTQDLIHDLRSISAHLHLAPEPSPATPTAADDDRPAYRHLLADARTRLGRWHQARLLWSLASLRPTLLHARACHASPADRAIRELCLRAQVADVAGMLPLTPSPSLVWRGVGGGGVLHVSSDFTELTGWDAPSLEGKLVTDVLDAASVVEYWEAFAELVRGGAPRGVKRPVGGGEGNSGATMGVVDETGMRGRVTVVARDGRVVPCAVWMTVKRDVWGEVGVVVGQFLPVGRW
ncbi:Transcriptional regulator of nonfermentable carbon utilization [Phlyctochytrium bullatum]|nr:Transcriptional regulator of nonfermentable carbon utilization [Phlyctochytrium bullatum]